MIFPRAAGLSLHMELRTYLNFPGNCREAFDYYEQHLGAKTLLMMTHPGHEGVMHGRLDLGGTILMASDVPHAEPMRSAYLTLLAPDTPTAERLYAALADGGQVLMKMEETFFAHRFGEVRDRFGINWMILHERACPDNS